jgi:hypothetical protein
MMTGEIRLRELLERALRTSSVRCSEDGVSRPDTRYSFPAFLYSSNQNEVTKVQTRAGQ